MTSVFLVRMRSCDDGCREATYAFTDRRLAETLAQRMNAARMDHCDVEEMRLDVVVQDVHTCTVLVRDGLPVVSTRSSYPANEHPVSFAWGNHSGATGYGFTEWDAEANARGALEREP